MKTKEEILKRHEYANFYLGYCITFENALEAMTEYARECCEEQKHICQTEFDKDSVEDENGKWYVSCEDILKCQLPEGL
jgi:hypothetical protein